MSNDILIRHCNTMFVKKSAIIILIGLINYHTARTSSVCGRPVVQPLIQRIVGGHEARQGSWPWMAMLVKQGRQTCGGVIISQYAILTAAHCFENADDMIATKWLVYVGKHHTNIHDTTESHHHVQEIIPHAGYDNVTVRNDIALLKLEEPIFYSDVVSRACLPADNVRMLPPGTTCYSTGWGDTLGTGDSTVLNQVGLPLLHDYWCSRNDWYGSAFIRYYTFCAGYRGGGKDACTGDSGGPINCHKDGTWYVLGLASWGYDCAQPHWPGIYTDLSKYISWIRETMLLHELELPD